MKFIDWVPNWHGAWPMVLLPPVIGMVMTGPNFSQFLLMLAWIFGFFTTYATVRFYKKRKRKQFPFPVAVYATICAILTIVLLVNQPVLAIWAILYGPIFITWLLSLLRGQERGVISRFVSIIGASFMIPVTFSAGVLEECYCQCAADAWMPLSILAPGWMGVYLVTFLLAAYFMGTVPLVKYLVRQRGNKTYLWFALLWHVIGALSVFVFCLYAQLQWWMLGAWILLLVRVIIFDQVSRIRKRAIPVRLIGRIEAVMSVIYLGLLLV